MPDEITPPETNFGEKFEMHYEDGDWKIYMNGQLLKGLQAVALYVTVDDLVPEIHLTLIPGELNIKGDFYPVIYICEGQDGKPAYELCGEGKPYFPYTKNEFKEFTEQWFGKDLKGEPIPEASQVRQLTFDDLLEAQDEHP